MSIKKLDLLRIITSSNYLYNFSSSYSNKALTASYALNASGGGGGTSGTSGASGSSGSSGFRGSHRSLRHHRSRRCDRNGLQEAVNNVDNILTEI